MKRTTIIFLLIFILADIFGQTHTISGYVTDINTGEKLIGANVFDQKSFKGTSTNTYGFYSLSLPSDSVEIIVSYVGFQPVKSTFFLGKDVQMNFELSSTLELKEVVITAENSERIEESTKMSVIKVPIEQIKSMPALLGENDVLKAIQMLPGVQSGMEGSSGIYVRGGGPDQNLILLDGTPVYNASHLFGFFSVFNADAINSIELIKGGFPARYGGRLSSVLDINMKEGNMKEIKGEGSIGIVASRLTVEGPIIKDKSSFIISARRTYLDIIAQPIIRAASQDEVRAGYFFYDLNGKVNYKFSDKDRLYLSTYMGRDKFYADLKPYGYIDNGTQYEQEMKNSLYWGNITSALRWNHLFNNKLFSNTTLTFSNYNFNISEDFKFTTITDSGDFSDQFALRYLSGIQDFSGKIDFDYMPNPDHYIRFGSNITFHTFKPGATTFKVVNNNLTNIDSTLGANKLYATEIATYVEDDYKISEKIKINAGIHYSLFAVKSNYYHSLQPRLSARYLLNNKWSIKASYAKMQQNIHLLTNSNIGLPTDLWVPSTEKVKPQISHQVAVGTAKTIIDVYQFSVEAYYKKMDNLIEYAEGANFFNNDSKWDDKVEIGEGWSYGVEFFLQKKSGNTTGWIGYTLSWTERRFDNLNFGEKFPYKYDRRHDISIVVNHKFNDEWSISGAWVYGTGNAVTLPTTRYMGHIERNGFYGFNELEYFENRNDYRMADYHRLDLSLSRTKNHKWGDGILTFGAYNVYSRRNPFFYYFGYDDRSNRVLKRISLFPIIPSISYNFKF
jgi:hypothetical protein